MKEWYNDIDSATLQRIKTYSAFNDAQSKNLMMQTMFEYREKEIQDFKETNHELALESIARQKRIAELEKENAELKKQLEMSNKVYNDNLDYSHHIEEQLTKAKELLERLLITSCNSDVLNLLPNCSEVLRVRVEAEQFIKDSEVEK